VGTGDVKESWGRNGLGARKGKVCTSRGSSETGCGRNTLVWLLGKRDEYLTFYYVSASRIRCFKISYLCPNLRAQIPGKKPNLKDSKYRRYG
jgi:hypothetical protein